ncbi:MAG: 3D-(3,5/4)-trihydroxycyclohexane-1,2-dione acylhydrolase (decyclizing) [Actinobacteria bacterium]|nr:3D-(3,5/4)-trihydroxycyclohexane-1,2-dione acylhydrolase (decyclizing) [Actinomycetota bacterium]
MKTVRLTAAQAIVRFLVAQRTTIEGGEAPLFPGVFAIYGHGNVIGLGSALHEARSKLPVYRGQNEQGMALAAIAFAKARRRRQIMVATSSIGPGATNMVTAAAAALANRLPLLILSGDTFRSRVPDPVLQQVEQFGSPSTTVNDAFRPVTRYWDRIVSPEQVAQSLPLAVETMLDPADCGPAFIGLPQDVQAELYDYPLQLFERRTHVLRRPRPDRDQLERAVALMRAAERPLIVAGGGVHYSLAEDELRAFAEQHDVPVVETMAGKSCLTAEHPAWVGPIGVTGCDQANRLAAEADVVLAIGTRLQDFTTGSWTVFGERTRIIALNVARFDATKHLSVPLVADAREGLAELSDALPGWVADDAWASRARSEGEAFRASVAARTAPGPGEATPTYAQVVGAINRLADAHDLAVSAAGGLPGELNVNWLAKGVGTFDCEYGYSTMGYEIAGAWGARMGRSEGEVIAFVGDGSYLMLNSELYSANLAGHKLIVVLCDNGGYSVIHRLQVGEGGAPSNNMLDDVRPGYRPVDWVAHAEALGCLAEAVEDVGSLDDAFGRARAAKRTSVIAIRTTPHDWTPGGAFWEVGVPSLGSRAGVAAAHERQLEGKRRQRVGW